MGERSEAIRARVEAAREVQRERFAETLLSCNADMGPTEVRRLCQLSEEGRALVKAAMQQLGMSARAFHRILKLTRTIGDLAGSEQIETSHLAEAIQYRPVKFIKAGGLIVKNLVSWLLSKLEFHNGRSNLAKQWERASRIKELALSLLAL